MKSALRSRKLQIVSVIAVVGMIAGVWALRSDLERSQHQGEASTSLVADNEVLEKDLEQTRPEGGEQRKLPSGKFSKEEFNHEILRTEWKQSTSRLTYLDRCLKSSDCDFASKDPDEYEWEIQRQMLEELKAIRSLSQRWVESGASFPKEAEQIARYFLNTGSDDAKLASLDILAMAPTSEENFQTYTRAIKETASSLIAGNIVRELVRYQDSSQREKVSRVAYDQIAHGPEAVGAEIAKYSDKLVTDDTAEAFAKLEKHLPPRSKKGQYLRLGREERERFQRGG